MKSNKTYFDAFESIFDYYNENMFSNKLPNVMLVLTTNAKKNPDFLLNPIRWKNENDNLIHEFKIHQKSLNNGVLHFVEGLIHEMVHLWQIEFGQPSRIGYHNKEWAEKIESLGLVPSDSGIPGGKKTGQIMNHYTQAGSKLDFCFKAMPTSLWNDLEIYKGNKNQEKESRKKTKYTCEDCGTNVWGKPNMKIACGCSNKPFIENKIK